MKLHFITSLSQEYWFDVAQYCVPTWDLPGKVTVYFEQDSGSIEWTKKVPYEMVLQTPPVLSSGLVNDRRKVVKFWGKSFAQITAIKNRQDNERIIWIDSDIEQLAEFDQKYFTFDFDQAVAVMNSSDGNDCWESGIVLFNQQNDKLGKVVKDYENLWLDPGLENQVWKPYDAQVLGKVVEDNYLNLCNHSGSNKDALANSLYGPWFKHWINKENKELLRQQRAGSSLS